jgi:hypothetical protein
MKPILALILLAFSVSIARAEEKPITLKAGPDADVVAANCSICHTLDYIPTNSPFMNRQMWTAEVNKMINAFGAPIAPDDAKKIIDYLVGMYGKPG